MARKRQKDTGGAPPSGGSAAGTAASVRIPGWLPPVLFVGLTGFLFRSFVFSDQMLFGNDTLGLGYVARLFYAEALKSGSFPLWNPEILGGTPFLEALSGGDSLYPPSVLLLLLIEPYRALGWKLVLHVLGAGFFMFGWARALGVSRPAALVSAVGYMLAPFLVSLVHPGHDGKMFVTALAPLVFWAVERHFARPRASTFASVALVVSLVIFTTHFQMAYFLFGAVGLYAIFRTVQVGRGTGVEDTGGPGATDVASPPRWGRAGARFGLFLAASVVGAAGAAVQFIPSAAYVTEYSRRVQTTREEAGETGRAWSSSWSLHPEEAMGLLIPEFAGNDAGGSAWSSGTYWGRNAGRDNLPTAGVVLLALAAVSFAGGARRGVRWFFAGLGATALLFALGTHTPVWGIFYAVVPGIRLFRAPDMVMFLFVLAAATLAGLGVDRLLKAAGDDRDGGWRLPTRVLWLSSAAMGVLMLLAASGALTSFWTTVVYRDVDPGRLQVLEALRPFITRGAFLSALLVTGVAGLAWGVRRGFLAPTALVAGLVVLVAADQLRVDGSFITLWDFHAWSRPDPNLQALLQLEEGKGEPYRLWNLARASQEVDAAMHGIELVAGHHPNDLSRYRELIGMVGSGDARNLYNPNVRRLLNVRYLLYPDIERGPGPEGGLVSRTTLADGRPYQTLYAEGGLPRARLVAAATVKPDDEAVPYMLSEGFDPEAEVVLAEAPPVALDGGPVSGSVRWEERTPNRLRLAVTSDRPALLVVADNWFPAWRATVDGAEAPVLRAYHTLRAVPVPAGSSTVEMTYRSELLARSLWLSVVTLLALGGVGVWGVIRERRDGAGGQEEAA
ncbi:MAG: hypothetical protein AMXMBFR53_06520 [Gemmatimonadota bacterium]